MFPSLNFNCYIHVYRTGIYKCWVQVKKKEKKQVPVFCLPLYQVATIFYRVPEIPSLNLNC